MRNVSPAVLLVVLGLFGLAAALLMPKQQPGQEPRPQPKAQKREPMPLPKEAPPAPADIAGLLPETDGGASAATTNDPAALRNQIKLLEGQVEYLQGQVTALQEENSQLIQKLGSLGMKGGAKMEPLSDDLPPDFVGMGLDMMKLRKLQALPIPTKAVSQPEVEASILRWLRLQQPGDSAPRFALALTALGWLDRPVDPLPLRAALLARQLGGWYDTESGTLLTIDAGEEANPDLPPPDRPMAVAFGQLLREFGPTLFPKRDTPLTTDERLAREALIAGDAGLTRFLLSLQNPTVAPEDNLPAEDPDHPYNQVMMPVFLKELAFFPFSRGFDFVQTLHSAGELAQVNAAYSRPPISSAEVIEAERYLDNNPLPPAKVEWPNLEVEGALPYWDDTLGRFACFTALRTYNDDEAAGTGAKGWVTDRLLVYTADSGPRDQAVWQTLWLTANDADAFFKAMRHCLLQRYDIAATHDKPDAVSLTAQGRTVQLLKNRSGNGVILIDAATPESAAALRSVLSGLPNPE